MFEEIAGDSADDLIVLHDALDFGHCHLALGVPMGGRFAGVDSLEQLKVSECYLQQIHEGLSCCSSLVSGPPLHLLTSLGLRCLAA